MKKYEKSSASQFNFVFKLYLENVLPKFIMS